MLQIVETHYTINREQLDFRDPRKEKNELVPIISRFSVLLMLTIIPYAIYRKNNPVTQTQSVVYLIIAIVVAFIGTVLLTRKSRKIFPTSLNTDCYIIRSNEFYRLTYEDDAHFSYLVKVFHKGGNRFLFLDNYFVRDLSDFPRTSFNLYRDKRNAETIGMDFNGEIIDPVDSFHLKNRTDFTDCMIIDDTAENIKSKLTLVTS